MRKSVCLLCLLYLAATLAAAVYKGESIDGRHFDAEIRLKENSLNTYRVDVVFVEKAANMVFAINQVLPATLRSDRYLTLYLKQESITDPDHIELLQLIPPAQITEDNEDPETWEVAAVWIMDLHIQ